MLNLVRDLELTVDNWRAVESQAFTRFLSEPSGKKRARWRERREYAAHRAVQAEADLAAARSRSGS